MRSKILVVLGLFIGIGLGLVISTFLKGQFKGQVENKILSTNTKQVAELPASSSALPSYHEFPIPISRDRVVKVLDGDTVVLEGGETVRYIGIDSTEKGGCFSTEATDENKKLVEGKGVRLEKDVSETDRYGRILRFVYVDDLFINDYLVRQGFAKAYRYPPDVKFSEQFEEAENEAKANSRGLWSSCAESTDLSSPSFSKTPIPKSIEGDRDCKDFKTHAEAQAFFESAGSGDVHKLDSDKDGLACESLP